MGLVNYASDSDSDSDSDSNSSKPIPRPAASRPPPKQSTVTRLVDASNPGKIIVNLPSLADDKSLPSDEPPAKRPRTGAASGSFAGFNAMLPPPKNANTSAALSRSVGAGISLKTSAEPGFSRSAPPDDGGGGGDDNNDNNDNDLVQDNEYSHAPTPAQPIIPKPQTKPHDGIRLAGKPLAFKPLSVSRKPVKKKPIKPVVPKPVVPSAPTTTTAPASISNTDSASAPRVSLFSMHIEAEPDADTRPYKPLFASTTCNPQQPAYDEPYGSSPHDDTVPAEPASLDSIADSLNLSASARRQLFGRHKGGAAATDNVRFVNMGDEYDRNEAMRASGELQPVAQPVRAIQAGKHSVRQMVSMVHNQTNALEESFARGRNNKREAGAKYGF